MRSSHMRFLFLVLSFFVVSEAAASDVMVRLFELQDCSIESLLADGYDIATVNRM